LTQFIFVDDGTGTQQGLSACLLEIAWILLACNFYATTVLASNAIVLVDIYWLFFREPTLKSERQLLRRNQIAAANASALIKNKTSLAP